MKNQKSLKNNNEGILDSVENKEKVIRKSYALTKHDLENILIIKDKCLNRKVVLNDSYVIRLALELTVKLTEDILIKASQKVPKIMTGRPKGS